MSRSLIVADKVERRKNEVRLFDLAYLYAAFQSLRNCCCFFSLFCALYLYSMRICMYVCMYVFWIKYRLSNFAYISMHVCMYMCIAEEVEGFYSEGGWI